MDYDFPRSRLYHPISTQDAPGLDAGGMLGIAACPNIKSGRRVADEQFVEVKEEAKEMDDLVGKALKLIDQKLEDFAKANNLAPPKYEK